MEELELPYALETYERDPETMGAGPELAQLSPFGKAPAIVDDELVLAESGGIIAHILDRYAGGRLQPEPGSDAWSRHAMLMHVAEATAMPALMVDLIETIGAQVPQAIRWIPGPTGAQVLDQLAAMLGSRPYILGDDLTAADIQLWFVMRTASARADFTDHPALGDYLARLEARPAFAAAVARGGPVEMQAA
jgi:glutathione S-transferase